MGLEFAIDCLSGNLSLKWLALTRLAALLVWANFLTGRLSTRTKLSAGEARRDLLISERKGVKKLFSFGIIGSDLQLEVELQVVS